MYRRTLARLELHVGDGTFTSFTWVFHYPYRAPNNCQKSSPMLEKNFEFGSKSICSECIIAKIDYLVALIRFYRIEALG